MCAAPLLSDPELAQGFSHASSGASSVNPNERRASEEWIKARQDEVDTKPGFISTLLTAAASNVPHSLFGSIVFKNTVKQCWNPSTAEHCIQEAEKTAVRQNVIQAVLASPEVVQRNLTEAIRFIADIDFPERWPNSLDFLINTLRAVPPPPPAVHCSALSTAHAVLHKYREQDELSPALVEELRAIDDNFFPPLLNSMMALVSMAEHSSTTPEAVLGCKGATAAVECIRDFISLDLGDHFIAEKDSVVDVFVRCLRLQNGCIAQNPCLVALKSVVLDCASHLLMQFEEDFEKDAGRFLETVWAVIADPASQDSSMDDLVFCAIGLLTSACRGTSRSVFDSSETIQLLLNQVVVPNLNMNEDEVFTYENEPDAFIQRDVEGSDLHTRRRAAGELVRVLVVQLPEKARPLMASTVNTLFSQGAADWRAKHVGIQLATALLLEGQHADAQRGATQRLTNIIPFDGFMRQAILPELSSPLSPTSPGIIKSSCMRAITVFRTHLDGDLIASIVGLFPTWMKEADVVIHTYTAHALERLLTVQHQNQYVITEQALGPYVAGILESLCGRLEQCDDTPNAYLMHCLSRLCQRVPGCVRPFLGPVAGSMNTALSMAVKNPSNPLYSYYLFEVISSCIAMSPDSGADFEALLWPNLTFILANDVLEYTPYALQLLSQLLSTHPRAAEPPEQYKIILPPLTDPALCRGGNIPAVVCLLATFIERYPEYVHGQGFTEKILNLFHTLVQLKNNDHDGLSLLTTMLIAYPRPVMDMYMSTILKILLQRLQTFKTPKFVRVLIIFLSIVVIVRDGSDLVTRMDAIQPGLFMMVLDRVWLQNVQKITGNLERKVCIVALSKLLCECPELQNNQQAWASSVYACLKMIHTGAEQDDHTSFSPLVASVQDLPTNFQQGSGEALGITSTNIYCPLPDAVRKPTDVCSNIADPDRYFRDQMTALLRGPGASLASVLQAQLTPDLLQLIL